MITSYDVLQTIIRTEKATQVEHLGQYFFKVSLAANKIEIKKAVEEIYKVQVASVNTIKVPGKRKRVRQEFGHTTPWKKAIVTLKKGHKIDVT